MPKFKVIFLGDQQVGKTTLLKSAIEGTPCSKIQPTIGVDNLFYYSSDVTLQCWDTSGSERFTKVIPLFARDCDMAVYVFDARRPQTLLNVHKWYNMTRNLDLPPKMHLLVANYVTAGQRVATEGFEEFEILDGRYPQDVMEEIITKICTNRESFNIERMSGRHVCCFGLCQ